MKLHFASRNNQKTNTVVSSNSEDPDDSQPVLNLEERERERGGGKNEFLTGTLRSDEGW